MHEHDPLVALVELLGDQGRADPGAGARIVLDRRGQRLVGDQLRLTTSRAASSSGSTSYRIAATALCTNETRRTGLQPDRLAGRRDPLGLAAQDARAQVEQPAVGLRSSP